MGPSFALLNRLWLKCSALWGCLEIQYMFVLGCVYKHGFPSSAWIGDSWGILFLLYLTPFHFTNPPNLYPTWDLQFSGSLVPSTKHRGTLHVCWLTEWWIEYKQRIYRKQLWREAWPLNWQGHALWLPGFASLSPWAFCWQRWPASFWVSGSGSLSCRHSQVLPIGHSLQGWPQAWPREQQQDALLTPAPISALQEMPLSPRSCTSKKQIPARVSAQAKMGG